ncbi:MAG: anti-sigma-K factor RskA [Alteromonas macleodii]
MSSIVAQDNSLVVVAAYVQGMIQPLVVRQVGASPQGHSLKLWFILSGGVPISIVIFATNANLDKITIPENLWDRIVGATLATSDEKGWWIINSRDYGCYSCFRRGYQAVIQIGFTSQ